VVEDGGDGSYSVQYYLSRPGLFQVHVAVDGQRLSGVPFVVRATPHPQDVQRWRRQREVRQEAAKAAKAEAAAKAQAEAEAEAEAAAKAKAEADARRVAEEEARAQLLRAREAEESKRQQQQRQQRAAVAKKDKERAGAQLCSLDHVMYALLSHIYTHTHCFVHTYTPSCCGGGRSSGSG
jgi:ATPase subunit of ABC transporter with duplicated ATPase domains